MCMYLHNRARKRDDVLQSPCPPTPHEVVSSKPSVLVVGAKAASETLTVNIDLHNLCGFQPLA